MRSEHLEWRTNERKIARSRRWAYIFLAPTIVLLLLFSYYPLFDTLKLSVQEVDLFGRPSGFVGLDNYVHMFENPDFIAVLVRTFIYVVLVVGLKVILGLAIALPLASELKGTIFIRPIVLIPMAFSGAVTAVIFRQIFAPKAGLLDMVLNVFGVDSVGWLTHDIPAMASLLVVNVWGGLGIIILLLIGALGSVPTNVLEAASIDGANGWQKLLKIKIPLISPTLFFVIVTSTISALREFATIQVLTDGGPNKATTTLTIALYKEAFSSNVDYSTSAAQGVLLMILVALVALVQFKLGEKKVSYS